jgi:hypothetical protein
VESIVSESTRSTEGVAAECSERVAATAEVRNYNRSLFEAGDDRADCSISHDMSRSIDSFCTICIYGFRVAYQHTPQDCLCEQAYSPN